MKSVVMMMLALVLGVVSGFAAPKVAKPEFSREKLNKVMRKLNKETFDTIYEWEPWLAENAGATLHSKTLRRLEHKAKSFGIELKSDFLADAKATAKRREKKAEYEKAKAEQAATADEEPAEE